MSRPRSSTPLRTIRVFVPQCPHCQSARVKTYSSRQAHRHYRCSNCGEKFKAIISKVKTIQFFT